MFITKSSEFSSFVANGQTSKQYKRIGKHLLLINCKIISYLGVIFFNKCFFNVENLYFTRMIYPVAKQTENNKLTNLTININSQHKQHDKVVNT